MKKILFKEYVSVKQQKDLLNDRLIIVIGIGGIGESIANNVRQAGAKVILVGRDSKKLNYDKERLCCQDYFCCDLEDLPSIKIMLDNIYNKYGCPDIIINCAGLRLDCDKKNNPLDVNEKDWDRVFDVNFRSNIVCLEEFERKLKKTNKKGCYVCISSIDGIKPFATPYGLSKSFLNEYIMDASKKMKNLRIYALAPGPTATKMMNDKLSFKYYRPDHPDMRCGVPQDIANVAVFLASDNCHIKSGSVVKSDGGMCL